MTPPAAFSAIAVHLPELSQATFLLQALHEPNPASHAIWIISAIALVVLAIIALVEAIDWLREWPSRRRADRRPEDEKKRDRLVLREPETRLRRRFFRRLRPRRRPWSDREG